MKILFLSRWFPYPPDNGARIRIFNLLKGLAESHQVDLISFYEEPVASAQVAELKRFLGEVDLVAYKAYRPGGIRAMMGFFSPIPRSYLDTHHPEMVAKVREAGARQRYDLVIASEIDMALYAREIRGAKKILEELEITKISSQCQSTADPLQRARYRLTWNKLSRYVDRLSQEFDGCTVVSELEREAVASCAAGIKWLEVIPNGVDTRRFSPPDVAQVDPNALVYTGAVSYGVNFEAVEYFVRQIFPLVLARHPEATLYVTGNTGGVPVDRLNLGDRVVFTGYVEDIRTVLARVCVNIVPIRTGGGTRLKILEGLAAGTPVVSTASGAEGLDLTPGRDFLLADDPQEFADAVVSLLERPDLRAELQRNGRALVEARYDWRAIVSQLEAFIYTVMGNAMPNSEIPVSHGRADA